MPFSKLSLIVVLSFLVTSILGQQNISETLSSTKKDTFAVLIGISDYQNEAIPDLRFAHKDAEAFAHYLTSPAGGNVDPLHIKLLLNSEATLANVVNALYWLYDNADEGDVVMLYFSGHGDVELKTIAQSGYLLCWDAPGKIYVAGGALSVPMFQDVITALSVEKKAKVLVFTDACRAGKLSGSSVGGVKITGKSLASQFANEVKLLSCQPDQFSLEGEQWGGGRGAFSYHLIEGLTGLADANGDLEVSLKEISRYLEKNVSAEVAPQNQLPFSVGNRREIVSRVNPEILEQMKLGSRDFVSNFHPTDSRGIEEQVISELAQGNQQEKDLVPIYRAFVKALEEKRLLAPVDNCADVYFKKLIVHKAIQPMRLALQRNFAAALQNDAQQALNNLLTLDVNELSLSKKTKKERYLLYPDYLQRAAQLLGPSHYMFNDLLARKLYFEAQLIHLDDQNYDPEKGKEAIALYRKSLELHPESPFVYAGMMQTFFFQLQEPDSSEYYAKLAVESAPTWVLPYAQLGGLYCLPKSLRNKKKAERYLKKADKIDKEGTNLYLKERWIRYYMQYAYFEKAEILAKEILATDPDRLHTRVLLARVYTQLGRFNESIVEYKRALEVDSTNHINFNSLGTSYVIANRFDEAELCFEKSIQLDSTFLRPRIGLMMVYVNRDQIDLAQQQFEEVIAKDPHAMWAYQNAAFAYLIAGYNQEALDVLLRVPEEEADEQIHLLNLGWAYFRLQRHEEARAIYERAVEVAPEHMEILEIMGLIYIRTNQLKEAEDVLKRALKTDKTNTKKTHLTLALLYEAQGKTDKAFESLEKALEKGYHYKDLTYLILTGDVELLPLMKYKKRWDTLLSKYYPEMPKDAPLFPPVRKKGI